MRSLTKKGKSYKTRLWEEKYNLKAIMRRDHKSDMGSPCRSAFTFILKQKTWSQRRLLHICREIDQILWKKIDNIELKHTAKENPPRDIPCRINYQRFYLYTRKPWTKSKKRQLDVWRAGFNRLFSSVRLFRGRGATRTDGAISPISVGIQRKSTTTRSLFSEPKMQAALTTKNGFSRLCGRKFNDSFLPVGLRVTNNTSLALKEEL